MRGQAEPTWIPYYLSNPMMNNVASQHTRDPRQCAPTNELNFCDNGMVFFWDILISQGYGGITHLHSATTGIKLYMIKPLNMSFSVLSYTVIRAIDTWFCQHMKLQCGGVWWQWWRAPAPPPALVPTKLGTTDQWEAATSGECSLTLHHGHHTTASHSLASLAPASPRHEDQDIDTRHHHHHPPRPDKEQEGPGPLYCEVF